MTGEKRMALRKAMAGKKISELNSEERELYDTEFIYKFATSNKPLKAPAVSYETPKGFNLTLTMEFLSRTSRLSPG